MYIMCIFENVKMIWYLNHNVFESHGKLYLNIFRVSYTSKRERLVCYTEMIPLLLLPRVIFIVWN